MNKSLNKLTGDEILSKIALIYGETNSLEGTYDLFVELKHRLERLEQLEKALDKACERLNWDCHVSQDLIDDLDCDNCNDDCKGCWKKYFLNLSDVEVLEND